jgi:hypothetical protein
VILPTFFIIGAAKSGTTSLHRYLEPHPELSMSSEKEPMCFEPPHWQERMSEYEDLFAGKQAAVRGESSTAYAAYPWVPEIPDRVKTMVPDAKIVYCVREPVSRMVSHYAQFVWDRMKIRPWEELMADLDDPMNMPVWISRYATQYERWAERFGEERILVVEQHDLATQREATIKRVLEFLEVDSTFTSPSWDERHNEAGHHRVPTALGERVGEGRRARLERVPPLRPLLSREIRKPVLRDDQRRRVEALLRPEVARFRAMTGLALPSLGPA